MYPFLGRGTAPDGVGSNDENDRLFVENHLPFFAVYDFKLMQQLSSALFESQTDNVSTRGRFPGTDISYHHIPVLIYLRSRGCFRSSCDIFGTPLGLPFTFSRTGSCTATARQYFSDSANARPGAIMRCGSKENASQTTEALTCLRLNHWAALELTARSVCRTTLLPSHNIISLY